MTAQAGYELMAVVGEWSSFGPESCVALQAFIWKFMKTMKPKTWRTLYSILNVLEMEGVAEEIESYLSGKCQHRRRRI